MADYSVDEISKMLKTNPETVRRWIRAGKLKVDSTLPYGAQGISEESLNDFIINTKEGRRRTVANNSDSSPALPGGVAVGAALLGFPLLSVAAGIIVDYAMSAARKRKEKVDEAQAADALRTHLQEEVDRMTQELMMLEEKREEIQCSIHKVSVRLDQYRACLANSDAIDKAVQNEINRRFELEPPRDEDYE